MNNGYRIRLNKSTYEYKRGKEIFCNVRFYVNYICDWPFVYGLLRDVISQPLVNKLFSEDWSKPQSFLFSKSF